MCCLPADTVYRLYGIPNTRNPAAQIANVHTVFNVTTTLILLPFGGLLVKAAKLLLPDRGEEEEETMRLMYLKPQAFHGEHQIGAVTLAISQLRQEISRMLRFANENVNLSFNAVKESTEKDMKRILYNEEYLDYLNAEISKCISRLISMEMPVGDSRIMNGYFKIAGNIERIGDHSMNVAGYAQALKRGQPAPVKDGIGGGGSDALHILTDHGDTGCPGG